MRKTAVPATTRTTIAIDIRRAVSPAPLFESIALLAFFAGGVCGSMVREVHLEARHESDVARQNEGEVAPGETHLEAAIVAANRSVEGADQAHVDPKNRV